MRALVQPRPLRGFVCGAIAATVALAPIPSTAQKVRAQSQTTGDIAVKAPQAVLMDAETGNIMFQRSGEELMHPASMSKLMLLAVVFKALKAGEIKLEDQFFMSEYAWRKEIGRASCRERVEDVV